MIVEFNSFLVLLLLYKPIVPEVPQIKSWAAFDNGVPVCIRDSIKLQVSTSTSEMRFKEPKDFATVVNFLGHVCIPAFRSAVFADMRRFKNIAPYLLFSLILR